MNSIKFFYTRFTLSEFSFITKRRTLIWNKNGVDKDFQFSPDILGNELTCQSGKNVY